MESWVQAKGTIRCLGMSTSEHSSPDRHFEDLHVDVFGATAPAFPSSFNKYYITRVYECYVDLQE